LGTSLDGVDYFARCCTIAGRIFIKQTGADPTQLMRSLMDEIFEVFFILKIFLIPRPVLLFQKIWIKNILSLGCPMAQWSLRYLRSACRGLI